jgi:hypothetical protein
VLTASEDRAARLRDASTGAEGAVLRGHERRVLSAVFDPSGARVVTVSQDHTQLWRVFPTVAALVEHARTIMPRALTPGTAQAVLPGLIRRHPLAVAGIMPI